MNRLIACGDHRYLQVEAREWRCMACGQTTDPAGIYTPCPGGLCQHHGEPVDENGKCPDCYTADVEAREYEAEVSALWNQR